MNESENSVHFWAKNITGYLGTVLLTIVYIPQVIRVYRRRDAQALSLIFLGIAWVTSIDMTAYGVLISEWPVIIANIMIFICVTSLLVAKWLFREKHLEDENV